MVFKKGYNDFENIIIVYIIQNEGDPMLNNKDIQVYAAGLDHPEGLVFDEEGNLYCGGELGQIYRISTDREVTELCCTGGFSLGMAFGPDGFLYVCNEEMGAVIKATREGQWEVFATHANGDKLLAPNMPVFDKQGRLYVSDSGHWGGHNGKIYRFNLEGEGELFAAGPYHFANGIAFDPDQTVLYVVESEADRIWSVPLLNDGTSGEASIFIDGLEHVPDGVTVDRQGNLYVSCFASNRIYRVNGRTREKEILLEDRSSQLIASPTNCVLAGIDENELYYAHLNARFIGKIIIK